MQKPHTVQTKATGPETNITEYKRNNPRPGSEYQQNGHTDHTPYMTAVQLKHGSSLKRKSRYIFKKLKVNISDSDREKRTGKPVIHPVLSKKTQQRPVTKNA